MCGTSDSLISHQTFHLGMTLLAHTRVLMKRVMLIVNNQAIIERVATFLAFQWEDIGRRMMIAHRKETTGYSGCTGAPKPNMLTARKSGSGSRVREVLAEGDDERKGGRGWISSTLSARAL